MPITQSKRSPQSSDNDNRSRMPDLEPSMVWPGILSAPHRSRPIRSSFWHKLRHERLLAIVMVTLALLILFHLWRGDTGLSFYRYEALRNQWAQNADVVFAGDSRTQFSICPQTVQKSFPVRILNYAFGGLQYDADYLTRLSRILDSESRQRCIVFGIAPSMFFEEKMIQTHTGSSSRMESWLYQSFPVLFGMTNPWISSRTCFTESGWAYNLNRSDIAKGVRFYSEKVYPNNRVSPGRLQSFLAGIHTLTLSGIQVYAYPAPSSIQLLQADRDISGLDYDRFIEDFKTAGGRWLEVPIQEHPTIDGIHLTREASLEFSGWLGHRLANQN